MSIESISSSPEEINVIEDILVTLNNRVYLNKINELDSNPLTKHWRLIVELNARLSEYSLNSWWYKMAFNIQDEILYPNDTYYLSGPRKGKKKEDTIKNILKIYNKYRPTHVGGPARRGTNPYSNVEALSWNTAVRYIEHEYKTHIVTPDLNGLREFLSLYKTELNEILSAIPDGNRGILSYMDIISGYGNGPDGLNIDSAIEESKKFANPLFTIYGLASEQSIRGMRGPYGWFKGKLMIDGPPPPRRFPRWPNLRVTPSSITYDSICEASKGLMKLLLEFIEPDVLNSKSCINPIVEIILDANKYYGNNLAARPDLSIWMTNEMKQTKKKLSIRFVKSFIMAGLSNNDLLNTNFDVLGTTYRPVYYIKETDSAVPALEVPNFEGARPAALMRPPAPNTANYPDLHYLFKDLRFIHPHDPYLNVFPRNLMELMHLNLRKHWVDLRKKFDYKKKLNFTVGYNDMNSPISILDLDTFRKVGLNKSHSTFQSPISRDSLRRNTFAKWSPHKDLVSAQQRLNTALGFYSPKSVVPNEEIDLINRIMEDHIGINLINEGKISENKLIKDIKKPSRKEIETTSTNQSEMDEFLEGIEEYGKGDRVSYISKKGVPYTGKVLENRGEKLLIKKDKGGKALIKVLDETLQFLSGSNESSKKKRTHKKK